MIHTNLAYYMYDKRMDLSNPSSAIMAPLPIWCNLSEPGASKQRGQSKKMKRYSNRRSNHHCLPHSMRPACPEPEQTPRKTSSKWEAADELRIGTCRLAALLTEPCLYSKLFAHRIMPLHLKKTLSRTPSLISTSG